jgi:hypothetical protein
MVFSNIKFCVKLEKNASVTSALHSEAYGGEAMKRSHVFEWHKQFKEDHKNVEYDERSQVHSGRHISISAMAVQLNLDKETVTCIEKEQPYE